MKKSWLVILVMLGGMITNNASALEPMTPVPYRGKMVEIPPGEDQWGGTIVHLDNKNGLVTMSGETIRIDPATTSISVLQYETKNVDPLRIRIASLSELNADELAGELATYLKNRDGTVVSFTVHKNYWKIMD